MVAIAPAFSGGGGVADRAISPAGGDDGCRLDGAPLTAGERTQLGCFALFSPAVPDVPFLDGTGLSAAERDVLRGQLGCFALATVLARDERFWREVEKIRSLVGPHAQALGAWELAGRVGDGGRRRAIAKLLLTVVCAKPHSRHERTECRPSEPFAPHPPAYARAALLQVGARAVWVGEEARGRSRTYRVGDAFLEPMRHGAGHVARALIENALCSKCGEDPSGGSQYCGAHKALLDVIRPAILAAPPLPLDLRAALEAEAACRARRPPPRPHRSAPVDPGEPTPSPAIAPEDRAEFERLMSLAPDPDAHHRIAERLAADDKQARKRARNCATALHSSASEG